MQGQGSGKRRAANVRLYADVVCMRHVADLLALGQAAAAGQIRLCDLDGHVLKIGGVLPAPEDPLAVGDGDVDVVPDVTGRFRGRCVGLFKEEDVVYYRNEKYRKDSRKTRELKKAIEAEMKNFFPS